MYYYFRERRSKSDKKVSHFSKHSKEKKAQFNLSKAPITQSKSKLSNRSERKDTQTVRNENPSSEGRREVHTQFDVLYDRIRKLSKDRDLQQAKLEQFMVTLNDKNIQIQELKNDSLKLSN